MKIVITVTSPKIDSEVDSRFGRGAYFLVVDPDTLEWQAHPNPGVSASGGAGTLAAQFVADQKAEAVISGDFGPNAYGALQAAGIAMYLFGLSRTGREAIERFKAGQLERVGAPTGQGRHQRG
ncbi:MAG: NifB/NifX family molybdenum-iron cluster-binding protein [Chloroflexi bacterium]|nr:NifB/NifX family molybdenum-iron cluster-binding protein [Chloroflexota bacterium]